MRITSTTFANVAIGFLGGAVVAHQHAATTPDVVVARSISIVDDRGKERMALGEHRDGQAVAYGLTIKDPNGVDRVKVELSDDGGALIRIRDAASHSRFVVDFANANEVALNLCGSTGESVVSLIAKDYEGACNGYLLARDSRGGYLCTVPSKIADGK